MMPPKTSTLVQARQDRLDSLGERGTNEGVDLRPLPNRGYTKRKPLPESLAVDQLKICS